MRFLKSLKYIIIAFLVLISIILIVACIYIYTKKYNLKLINELAACRNDLKSQNKSKYEEKSLLKDFLRNPNKLVYKYINLPEAGSYSTHTIPLVVSALFTEGPILELGMGLHSTPILHKIGLDFNRFVVSVETDKKWMEKFNFYNDSETHLILLANKENWETFGNDLNCSLVFVDHLDAYQRHLDVIRFANKSKIVVAHDSEQGNSGYYFYTKAYKYFKYHLRYRTFIDENNKNIEVATSLFSNFVDLSQHIYKILFKIKTSYKIDIELL